MNVARHMIGISMGIMLVAGTALATEPAEVEKFVKARIDIGEMMTNYFKDGGMSFGEGQRPSLARCAKCGTTSTVNSTHSCRSMI
jgi:hypothetical protein